MTAWMLIALHMLADFTCQPTKLARAKEKKLRYVLLHGAIYALVLAAGFFLAPFRAMLVPYLIIVVSHGTIDLIRVAIDRRQTGGKARFASFAVDQLLHIAIIVLMYFCFDLGSNTTGLLEHTVLRQVAVYAAIVSIIWDPAAIWVQKLLASFSDTQTDHEPGAGALIGKLERVILAVLVAAGQLSGIGFVLAAKSLARFKQLEDKDFAQMYLIGTLASAAIAVIIALLLLPYLK